MRMFRLKPILAFDNEIAEDRLSRKSVLSWHSNWLTLSSSFSGIGISIKWNMIYVQICQHHWNQHKIWIPSTWTSLSFSSVLLSFNSWNLSIRSSYELLFKVLGYEFLPWSLPSLALFLNLFLAYERGPRKYYVRFVVLRTILNKNYDWFPRAKGQYERCTSEI